MCIVLLNVNLELWDIQHMEKFAVLYVYGVEDTYLDFVLFFPRILYQWIHAINLRGV
jgi:hypothetical protein